ncbi:MAG: hypothetical protein J6B45_03160 [Clostridia bacterium]|nr:hypothetical protein [Clostridia bacterium]
MKKKLLILFLALALALCAFAACGEKQDPQGSGTQNSGTTDNSGTGNNSGGTTPSQPTTPGGDQGCQHNYKVVDEIEATCLAPRKTIKECTICGDRQEIEEGNTASHISSQIVKTEATCTTDGERACVCATCGTTMFDPNMEQVIPKLGHTYERTENMFDEAAGVTFIPGNCDEEGRFERVCGDCGYNEDPITRDEYAQIPGYDTEKYDAMEVWGHDYSVKIGEGAATCTEGSYIEYACSRDGCTSTKRETKGYPKGHKYITSEEAVEGVNYVIDPKPTCLYEGKKIYVCINEGCGERATEDKYIEVVPVLNHDTSNRDAAYLERDVAATCALPAYKVYRCCVDALCEVTETVYEGEPLPHLWEVSGPQTCKTEGKTPYKCTRQGCEETKLDTPIDLNIKHTYESVVKEATCINNAVYKCAVCEEEYAPYENDDFYKNGFAHGVHVFEYSETVAPTCSSIGYKIYACTADENCVVTRKDPNNTDLNNPDLPLKEDIVARTAHNFDLDGNGTIDVSPDGKITCAVCFTQYRDITTEITNGNGTLCLGCGNNPCDCGLSVEWNGYVSPIVPSEHVLAANKETVISSIEWTEVENKGTVDLAIGEGMIIVDGEENTTYTIKVYDKADGTLLHTFEVSGDVVLVDLYDYLEVGQVAITASTTAIVYLYSIVK